MMHRVFTLQNEKLEQGRRVCQLWQRAIAKVARLS